MDLKPALAKVYLSGPKILANEVGFRGGAVSTESEGWYTDGRNWKISWVEGVEGGRGASCQQLSHRQIRYYPFLETAGSRQFSAWLQDEFVSVPQQACG